VLFSISQEEIAVGEKLIKENEKLLTSVMEQLEEQRNLLAELGKKQNMLEPVQAEGGDVMSRLAGSLQSQRAELAETLAQLKKDSDDLRKQVEALRKK
jgi:flagellar biosynthesis chaperone FliJ